MSNQVTPAMRLALIFNIAPERVRQIEEAMKEADNISTSNIKLGLSIIWGIGKNAAKTPEEYALVGALIGEFQATLIY